MKSVSKFLSCCLFASLIASSGINADFKCAHCYDSKCKVHRVYHPDYTLKLPCGCENHINCLLAEGSVGGFERTENQYKCLNPNCPRQYDFETGENFWRYMWQNVKPDPESAVDGWRNKYEPSCNPAHSTFYGLASEYWRWLKNRNNDKNGQWWSHKDYNNATSAYNNKKLCAICGTGK